MLPVDTKALIQEYVSDNSWDLNKLTESLPLHLAAQLSLMPFNDLSPASPVWKCSSNGVFTTKSAWNLVRRRKAPSRVLACCWDPRVPTTVSVFWWKLLHNWLPVDEVLQHKGIILASKCQCCNHCESISHVILWNTEVNKVWVWFSGLFQVQIIPLLVSKQDSRLGFI